VTKHLPEKSAPGTSEQVPRGPGGVGKIPAAVQYAHCTWMRLHRGNNQAFSSCKEAWNSRSSTIRLT